MQYCPSSKCMEELLDLCDYDDADGGPIKSAAKGSIFGDLIKGERRWPLCPLINYTFKPLHILFSPNFIGGSGPFRDPPLAYLKG